MSDDQTKQAIGQAWSLHRNAQNEEAISTFKTVLNSQPDDLDANYGIGLAYRAVGDNEKAVEHMRKAHNLALKLLRDLRAENEAEGVHIANNLSTTLDDRYMMLTRMTHQRLAELGVHIEVSSEEIF